MGSVLPYIRLTGAIWCNTPKSARCCFSRVQHCIRCHFKWHDELTGEYFTGGNILAFSWSLFHMVQEVDNSCAQLKPNIPHVSSASPAEGTEPLQTKGRLSSHHNDLKAADLLPSYHVQIYLHRNFNSSLCCWRKQREDTGKLCWEVILGGHQAHLSADYCQRTGTGHLTFVSIWATFRNSSAFCICVGEVGAQICHSNVYIDYLPQILPCNANSVTHNYRLLGKTASNMGAVSATSSSQRKLLNQHSSSYPQTFMLWGISMLQYEVPRKS